MAAQGVGQQGAPFLQGARRQVDAVELFGRGLQQPPQAPQGQAIGLERHNLTTTGRTEAAAAERNKPDRPVGELPVAFGAVLQVRDDSGQRQQAAQRLIPGERLARPT